MRSGITAVLFMVFATVWWAQETKGLQRFQCTFKNELYHLERNGNKDQYVWGRAVKPLVYKSKRDFEASLGQFDELKREFYEDNIGENFGSYMDTFKAMSHYGAKNGIKETIKDFSAFYKPKKTYRDNMGQLLEHFKQLTEVAGVQNHAFIAVAGKAKDFESTLALSDEPPSFTEEFLVGIIKVSVGGKLGYVVIDLQYPGANALYAFENDKPEKLIGKNKTYLKILANGLIYVGKPLCNFVSTHTRELLMYTDSLYFAEYFRSGDLYYKKGFLTAQIFTVNGTKRFTVGYDDVELKESVNLPFHRLDQVYENDEYLSVFQTAEEAFDSEGILEEKVSQFEDFLKLNMMPWLQSLKGQQ